MALGQDGGHTPHVGEHSTRSILRDPAFGRLWFIQAATQVGGNMALYALTILVFATTRSNAAVSALDMSFLVPPIRLSAVAGVVVDQLDVRWALVVPNAHRMQQMVEEDHKAIAQVSYSFQNQVHWLRGLAGYFSDTALHERLLLERYEKLLPRLDEAIGDE